MIDSKIVKQLKSSDANKRRQAIGMLADSRDPDALKHLEEVARNDKDEKLRKLAVRAQDHLKKQLEKAQEREAAPASEKEIPTEVMVTEKDIARARDYTEEALSMYINQDNARAAQRLVKALEANPNLKTDSYFLGIAGNVLDVPQEHAMAVLMDGSKRADFISQSKTTKVEKRKKEHRSKADELGWGSVSFDLTIYGAVTAVVTFLSPFVVTQLLGRAIDYQQALPPEKLAEEAIIFSNQFSQFNQWLSTVGVVIFLIAALVTAVFNVIGMLVYSGVVHVFATKILHGVGTLPFLMSKMVPFYSMLTGVIFIWWIIAMTLAATGAVMIGGLCLLPMALLVLFRMFQLGGRIAESYDFGTGMGCMTLIIANVIVYALSMIPGLVVQNMLAQAIASSITGGA